MFHTHRLIALVAIAAVFLLIAGDAHARVGGGFSTGGRGMRTFSAPPATPTAPTAAPIQRSMTHPHSVAPIGQTATRPGLFNGGLFGGGLFGGLAAGFLGAGLFGLLFGQGLFGGMAGFSSIIGLLLQVLLVVSASPNACSRISGRLVSSFLRFSNHGNTSPPRKRRSIQQHWDCREFCA
jgi:predicted lipid-binding transport protein (Tim44 family)